MHLFGEGVFNEEVPASISSLFKLTLGEAAAKILTFSPKRCMNRQYIGIDITRGTDVMVVVSVGVMGGATCTATGHA
jgi:hypothetical protein